MKGKFNIVLVLLLAGLVATAAFGGGEQEGQAAGAQTEAPSLDHIPDFVDLDAAREATSGERFDGVTVTVTTITGYQGEFLKEAAAGWEAATGGRVELNMIPFGELQDKVLTALTTGVFIGDVLNLPSYLAGDLMGGGYIERVPDEVKARLSWDDIIPLYQRQTEWAGETFAYPWDGDNHMMFYRKDLLADPDMQAAFEEEFGYELSVPRTWEQYNDVAEFFTGDWGDGERHYGSVELIMRKNQGFHGFISRAAPFAKMPDDPALLFDPDTMDARVANPGFVRALESLIAVLPYSPPDMPNFGFIENAQAFAGGLVALDVQWSDIGPISVDPEMSIVQGKVGFDITPGSTEVWNSNEGRWESMPEVNHAPYAAFGGWGNMVAANARAKEAAIDLAAYYASPPIMQWAALTSGSGVNPARYSTVNDYEAWDAIGFEIDDAEEYLNAIAASQEHPNAVFQLRIPGYVQYQDALELAVSKALSGQATAEEALAEAAEEWDRITDRIGREDQLRIYRDSLGM